MIKTTFLVGMMLILSACATGYQQAYIYYRFEVVNNSNETLSDVKVTLTSVNRSYDCGDIAPLRICSQGFGKRRYVDDPILVDWSFAGGARQSSEFVIEAPATYATGIPMKAMIEVSPEGEMTAYFKQYSSF